MVNFLIVEDNDLSRMCIELQLKKNFDGDVTSLSCSSDALELIQSNKIKTFDVFISDWCIPRESGEMLLRMAKDNNPEIKTILYTCYDNEDIKKHCSLYKIDKVLIKDGKFKELVNEINYVMKDS